jgi:hypothetical protein
MHDPSFTKSKTESEEPNRLMPNTERVLPRRAKLLRERDEPIRMKSRSDTEEPKRDKPNTDKVDPKRAILRIDKDAPMLI